MLDEADGAATASTVSSTSDMTLDNADGPPAETPNEPWSNTFQMPATSSAKTPTTTEMLEGTEVSPAPKRRS